MKNYFSEVRKNIYEKYFFIEYFFAIEYIMLLRSLRNGETYRNCAWSMKGLANGLTALVLSVSRPLSRF